MLVQKIFSELIYPLATCLVLVPLGSLLRWRWPRFGTAVALAGVAWLGLWSLPSASLWLRGTLEHRYTQQVPAVYPVADAIVVLGGGMEGSRKGKRERGNLLNAGDRVWFGAQLWRAGRAPVLILSGGNAEWSASDQPEAEAMATFLVDLGVPRGAMLLESQSLTTHENALRTREVMQANGIRRVLLVTSALHMRRAMAAFAAAGIDAVPAPTDFEAVPPREMTVLDWLPDAGALEGSTRAIKEYVGYWVYRVRGWAV
jgi:uncharacterized SAM-binding protein YcdF (DUF218 family)